MRCSLGAYSPTGKGFETFALEEFKVDPELSLSLAALQGFQTVSISSLDDSASLQGFLEFSSIADRCIDACHRVSVAVQARISLLDKFDRIQKLYLSVLLFTAGRALGC